MGCACATAGRGARAHGGAGDPAPLIAPIAPRLPTDTLEALGRVRFGPMVVLSIRTGETGPMPWDDIYSILTPDKRFNMFFNHANFAHTAGFPSRAACSWCTAAAVAPARLGARRRRDPRRFLADLDGIYPQLREHIVETMVSKWVHAGPFAAPGRWRAQELIERGVDDRVFFAGDWVSEFVSMETAARTGVDAAARVGRRSGASDVPDAPPLRGRPLSDPAAGMVLVEWSDPGGVTSRDRPIAGLHVHHQDDEAWYVLQGRLGFQLGPRS